MKRSLALLLTWMLCLSILAPVPAVAVETETVIQAVSAAVDGCIAATDPGDSAYDGTFQLLSHALFGGGADLAMDREDAFTGLAAHTIMGRTAMIAAAKAGISWLLRSGEDHLYLQGGCEWYPQGSDYYYYDVLDMDISGMQHHENIIGNVKADVFYHGAFNAYDEGMKLVAGSTSMKVTIRRKAMAPEAVTYSVFVRFQDDFDFNGTYEGDDTSLSNAMKWFGNLLTFGAVIKPFRWTADLEFDVVIPDYCTHTLDGAQICTRCGYRANAPLAGTWETDFTLSAAELGVNTEDARLRCTLNFGSDGRVTASWRAIDLSAFREFYHTLFVNAYYACGYGAGITSLEEIEAACQAGNGMSVSDYIYTFLDGFDINALFTPAPASGSYSCNKEQTALFTDLPIMGNPSDPAVANAFTVEGNTLKLTASSWNQPNYTFVCTKK